MCTRYADPEEEGPALRGRACVFAGPCRKKWDCEGPCSQRGHPGVPVLCELSLGHLTCCCLQN
ncbi:hypothetical protein Taro_041049 [Colocasia esculenta]|uniref:Uncharacterized protein n=1 Tax=Colocasia esculenta TaxID=4460 RepID=A0A843WKI6_COLES|nr:hypothetical protein [Colocasia esculenta]